MKTHVPLHRNSECSFQKSIRQHQCICKVGAAGLGATAIPSWFAWNTVHIKFTRILERIIPVWCVGQKLSHSTFRVVTPLFSEVSPTQTAENPICSGISDFHPIMNDSVNNDLHGSGSETLLRNRIDNPITCDKWQVSGQSAARCRRWRARK